MATRNMGVKTAPERWQDNVTERFDVVVTFEQGVFDRVLEGKGNEGRTLGRKCWERGPVFVFL